MASSPQAQGHESKIGNVQSPVKTDECDEDMVSAIPVVSVEA
jgi:hypothetical protein